MKIVKNSNDISRNKMAFSQILLLIALPLISIPGNLFVLMIYGWTLYSILTGRSGMYGEIYTYYNEISKVQFILYSFILSVIPGSLIVLEVFYLLKQRIKPILLLFIFLSYFWNQGIYKKDNNLNKKQEKT